MNKKKIFKKINVCMLIVSLAMCAKIVLTWMKWAENASLAKNKELKIKHKHFFLLLLLYCYCVVRNVLWQFSILKIVHTQFNKTNQIENRHLFIFSFVSIISFATHFIALPYSRSPFQLQYFAHSYAHI